MSIDSVAKVKLPHEFRVFVKVRRLVTQAWFLSAFTSTTFHLSVNSGTWIGMAPERYEIGI